MHYSFSLSQYFAKHDPNKTVVGSFNNLFTKIVCRFIYIYRGVQKNVLAL
jgi:hypothetical protein